jgi:hypothetical protein
MVRWRTGDSEGICEVSGSHSCSCSVRLARAALSSGVVAKGEVRTFDVLKPVTDVFHSRIYWGLAVVCCACELILHCLLCCVCLNQCVNFGLDLL